MLRKNKLAAEFLPRARREAARYGEDPFLFLREWVQNGRDAGADAIHFEWKNLANGEVQLSCEDNGCGMSSVDVKMHLLRLYASGKENKEGNLGQFGVGFWSLLLCNPSRIFVESKKRGSKSIGFCIWVDAESIEEFSSVRTQSGTRVCVVFRSWDFVERLHRQAISRLRKDAGNVRSKNKEKELEVFFDGIKCNEDFQTLIESEKCFCLKKIVEKDFEGWIGLGKKAKVQIYSGGLLVREESDLSALLPQRTAAKKKLYGLQPVVFINADGLQVLLNRQNIYQSKLLKKLVLKTQKMLFLEQLKLIDELAPMGLIFRLKLIFRRLNYMKVAFAGVLMGMFCLLFWVWSDGFSLNVFQKKIISSTSKAEYESPRLRERSVSIVSNPKHGPVVDSLDAYDVKWAFSYTGEGNPLFRMDTWSKVSAENGLSAVRLGENELKSLPKYPLLEEVEKRLSPIKEAVASIRISLGLPKGKLKMAVPVPLDFVLDVSSVEVVPNASVHILLRKDGVALVLGVLEEESSLQYRTVPGRISLEYQAENLRSERRQMQWPAEENSILNQVQAEKSAKRKAVQVQNWVQKRLRYTVLAADAEKNLLAKGDFIPRVLELGFGDCDVMNTLAARLLLASEVRAQVGIGFVGREGTLAPQLHAWTEYWADGHWEHFDASRGQAAQSIFKSEKEVAETLSETEAVHEHLEQGVLSELENEEDFLKGMSFAKGRFERGDEQKGLSKRIGAVLFGMSLLGAGLLKRKFKKKSLNLRFVKEEENVGFRANTFRKDDLDEPLFEMLRFMAVYPDASDAFNLRERAFLSTYDAKKMSLQQAKRLEEMGMLIGMSATCFEKSAQHRTGILRVDNLELEGALYEKLFPQIVLCVDDEGSEFCTYFADIFQRSLMKAIGKAGEGVSFLQVQFEASSLIFVQEALWPDGEGGLVQIGTKSLKWQSVTGKRSQTQVFELTREIVNSSSLLEYWGAPLLAEMALFLFAEEENAKKGELL